VKRFRGEGGRKRVYLAHDTRLDRDVAFAVIKTEGLDEAGPRNPATGLLSSRRGSSLWKGGSFDQYEPHGRDPAGYADLREVTEFLLRRQQRSRTFRHYFTYSVITALTS